MKKQFIEELYSENGFTMINLKLAKKIGLTEAFLFKYLLDLQENIFSGNEFFQQQSRIEEETGLSEHIIRSTVKRLIDLQLLTSSRKGVPCKIYYYIDYEKCSSVLNELLDDNNLNIKMSKTLTTSSKEIKPSSQISEPLDVKNVDYLTLKNETSYTIPEYTISNKTISESSISKETISEDTIPEITISNLEAERLYKLAKSNLAEDLYYADNYLDVLFTI